MGRKKRTLRRSTRSTTSSSTSTRVLRRHYQLSTVASPTEKLSSLPTKRKCSVRTIDDIGSAKRDTVKPPSDSKNVGQEQVKPANDIETVQHDQSTTIASVPPNASSSPPIPSFYLQVGHNRIVLKDRPIQLSAEQRFAEQRRYPEPDNKTVLAHIDHHYETRGDQIYQSKKCKLCGFVSNCSKLGTIKKHIKDQHRKYLAGGGMDSMEVVTEADTYNTVQTIKSENDSEEQYTAEESDIAKLGEKMLPSDRTVQSLITHYYTFQGDKIRRTRSCKLCDFSCGGDFSHAGSMAAMRRHIGEHHRKEFLDIESKPRSFLPFVHVGSSVVEQQLEKGGGGGHIIAAQDQGGQEPSIPSPNNVVERVPLIKTEKVDEDDYDLISENIIKQEPPLQTSPAEASSDIINGLNPIRKYYPKLCGQMSLSEEAALSFVDHNYQVQGTKVMTFKTCQLCGYTGNIGVLRKHVSEQHRKLFLAKQEELLKGANQSEVSVNVERAENGSSEVRKEQVDIVVKCEPFEVEEEGGETAEDFGCEN